MNAPNRRAVIRVLIQAALMVAAVAFMMASIGCKPLPTKADGPPAEVRIPCPDITPLEVLPGLNSNQLDQVLYAAYLDVLTQYIACQQQAPAK